MDYSYNRPVQRNVSSILATPATSSTFDTARTHTQSYLTAEKPSADLMTEVMTAPKPILSSTKMSQVVTMCDPRGTNGSVRNTGAYPINFQL